MHFDAISILSQTNNQRKNSRQFLSVLKETRLCAPMEHGMQGKPNCKLSNIYSSVLFLSLIFVLLCFCLKSLNTGP